MYVLCIVSSIIIMYVLCIVSSIIIMYVLCVVASIIIMCVLFVVWLANVTAAEELILLMGGGVASFGKTRRIVRAGIGLR